MRRWIAILLGVAFGLMSGQVPALHVHAYADHDHPEHQHGPAVHGHHAPKTHTADAAEHLESCDPARHTISFAFVCGAPQHPGPIDTEFVSPVAAAPELPLHHTLDLSDVRVHGPPPRAQSPPRAPPLIVPA